MVRIILVLAAWAMAQQTYVNANFNAKIEVPGGWSMNAPDTSLNTVSIKLTRVGLQPVTIVFSKWSSYEVAGLLPSAIHFYNMKWLFDRTGSSTQAPLLTHIQDTTISNSNGIFTFSSFVMRHNELDRVMVSHAAAYKEFVQAFGYTTTTADYNTNTALYFDVWNNTTFNNIGPTVAAKASIPMPQPSRLAIYNVLGQRVGVTVNAPRVIVPLR